MNITTNRKELASALKAIQPAVPKTSTLPALECVRLEVDGDLSATASNVDITATTTMAGSAAKAGVALTPAALLARVIEKLPADKVTLTVKKGRVVVTSGETVATLPTVDESTWPKLPEADGEPCEFSAADAAAVAAVVPFASKSVTGEKPGLGGVCFHGGVAVATEGFRLGEASDLPDLRGAIVPASAVRMVFDDRPISARIGDRVVSFATESLTVTTRLIEDEYPDYRKVYGDLLKGKAPHSLTLSADDLADAVDRVASIGLDVRNPYVKLTRDGDKLMVTGADGVGNSVVDVLPCSGDYEQSLAFHPSRLIETLRTAGGEITMGVTSPLGPVVWLVNRLALLIMPVRG